MKLKVKHLFTIFLINFFLLASSTVFAVTDKEFKKDNLFDISSKFLVDGIVISSPSMVVRANHPSSLNISNNYLTDLNMTVVLKNVTIPTIEDAVRVNFDILYGNGENNLHLKPQLILMLNQEGRIKLSNAGHSYEMIVIVKRK